VAGETLWFEGLEERGRNRLEPPSGTRPYRRCQRSALLKSKSFLKETALGYGKRVAQKIISKGQERALLCHSGERRGSAEKSVLRRGL